MQAALQYMAGEMKVERGDVLPLLATHNTVRMRFDMEEAEYLHLTKTDAAFPLQHFSMLADTARNEVRAWHSSWGALSMSGIATIHAIICWHGHCLMARQSSHCWEGEVTLWCRCRGMRQQCTYKKSIGRMRWKLALS